MPQDKTPPSTGKKSIGSYLKNRYDIQWALENKHTETLLTNHFALHFGIYESNK